MEAKYNYATLAATGTPVSFAGSTLPADAFIVPKASGGGVLTFTLASGGTVAITAIEMLTPVRLRFVSVTFAAGNEIVALRE